MAVNLLVLMVLVVVDCGDGYAISSEGRGISGYAGGIGAGCINRANGRVRSYFLDGAEAGGIAADSDSDSAGSGSRRDE